MILIDYRKGSKELEPYIQTAHKIATLEFADFCFTGLGEDGPAMIGIERKTIGDMMSSMNSGRLSGHQLIGLLDQYAYVYLLIEGIWRPNPKSGVLEKRRGKSWTPVHHGKRKYTARELWNYVNTLAIMCGVHTVYTTGMAQSGLWLDSTYTYWQRDYSSHKSHLKFHRQDVKPKGKKAVMLRPPTPFERIISGVSGVGFGTATLLEKHFKTPLELALATEDQLTSIKGIGPKIAKLIIRELRGQ